MAGIFFWLGVYPIDVVKARLQTQRFEAPQYSGVLDCARQVGSRAWSESVALCHPVPFQPLSLSLTRCTRWRAGRGCTAALARAWRARSRPTPPRSSPSSSPCRTSGWVPQRPVLERLGVQDVGDVPRHLAAAQQDARGVAPPRPSHQSDGPARARPDPQGPPLLTQCRRQGTPWGRHVESGRERVAEHAAAHDAGSTGGRAPPGIQASSEAVEAPGSRAVERKRSRPDLPLSSGPRR